MNITSSTLKEGNVLVDDAADKVIAALGGNDVLRAISVLDQPGHRLDALVQIVVLESGARARRQPPWRRPMLCRQLRVLDASGMKGEGLANALPRR